MWQWFRFLLRQVPPGKPVLLLNLDETSIRFWYEPRLGLRSGTGRPPRAGFARQASRAQLRKALSHIAIICDDTSLQPHLPQVLLANERTVTAEMLRNWTSLPGCTAEIWRGKSAWINNKVFGRIVRRLGKALQEHAADRQAILLLDAHTCHFSEEALAAARDWKIWPCIVPASMTSTLQPLDTHVFSRFKMFLRTRLHQVMLAGPNKDLTCEQVVDALMHAIKGVMQSHAWAPAFARNGFGPTFEIREHLLETFAWHTAPVVCAELPSYAQFALCFPARRHIPFMQLLSGVLPPSARGAKRAAAVSAETGTDDGEVLPWLRRLRPRLRGRVCAAKAKPAPAPLLLPAPADPAAVPSHPASSTASAGGRSLPMGRPLFPRRLRRSTSDLP